MLTIAYMHLDDVARYENIGPEVAAKRIRVVDMPPIARVCELYAPVCELYAPVCELYARTWELRCSNEMELNAQIRSSYMQRERELQTRGVSWMLACS